MGIIVLGYKIFYTEATLPVENQVGPSASEIEKKIPTRDLLGQFQKFSETFKVYQSWTPEQQKIYREQYHISEDFIKKTEAYLNSVESMKQVP